MDISSHYRSKAERVHRALTIAPSFSLKGAVRFKSAKDSLRYHRKPRGGVPKRTASQKAELAVLVEAGPDPQSDGVARWRRLDLKEVIRDRFGVDYHERSVSRLPHDLSFSHMSAQLRHLGQER